MKHRAKSHLLSVACLAVAASLWLPTVHVFFTPDDEELESSEVSHRAEALLAGQLAFWERTSDQEAEQALMRYTNPEWDFMGRTFTVLSLANMAIREPGDRERYLMSIDRIIEDTLEEERTQGAEHFLMSYWQRAPFLAEPARTVFVEGELALMLGARQLVEERTEFQPLLRTRIDRVIAMMEAGPVLSAESYPDECWTVCNAFALAAIRIADAVHSEDHSELLGRWLDTARIRLVDENTGMLVSEYTYGGQHLDGPEGSSIFLVAHLLQLVDEEFARDQYDRARATLGVDVAGFAYAREWPASWPNMADVDSGPTIPIVGANAGASGLAIVGAAAFGDQEFLRGLMASLDFAAFPMESDDGLRYGASNQVGDAVMLYALVQGPLWERVLNSERSI